MSRLISYLFLMLFIFSMPTYAGWTEYFTETKNFLEGKLDKFEELAKMSKILSDLKIIQKDQNQAIQDIYKDFERAASGKQLKDAWGDIYTYEHRKKLENLEDLSEIASKNVIKVDIFKKSKNWIEGYILTAKDYDNSDISVHTKEKISDSRKDRHVIDELTEEAKANLGLKQNQQNIEANLLTADHTSRIKGDIESIQKMMEEDLRKRQARESRYRSVYSQPTNNSTNTISLFRVLR